MFWLLSAKVTGRRTLLKSRVGALRPIRTFRTSLIISCAYQASKSSVRWWGCRATMPLYPGTLPAAPLVFAPLTCRNWKPNDAPRQSTSFSASMPRPIRSALLLVQPPGWAPPAATRLVSASHSPPSVMPHSSCRPSVRPSQPVPVEYVVAAGLPLTAATCSIVPGVLTGPGGLCATVVPEKTAKQVPQSTANDLLRIPQSCRRPPRRQRFTLAARSLSGFSAMLAERGSGVVLGMHLL